MIKEIAARESGLFFIYAIVGVSLNYKFFSMQMAYFVITGNNSKSNVIEFVADQYPKSYRADIMGGSIFFIEDYSVLAHSDLLICIRIQDVPDKTAACEVEMVCGGGGEGIFSIKFGNEGRRIDKLFNKISDYCVQMNYSLSHVAATR
jgi:hypothetical protein